MRKKRSRGKKKKNLLIAVELLNHKLSILDTNPSVITYKRFAEILSYNFTKLYEN